MRKVKVLFFAADPLSLAPDRRTARLRLDEDVREIRERVEQADNHDALEFNYRLAARTDDLLRALRKTRPQVVHFSGHGESDGLVLVSADGLRPRLVPAAVLVRLFEHFRGDIRVVVLNACFSLPQAQAIAQTVGCAIGTRRAISDEGAITFGASFYRAIASGESVQGAFNEAQLALAMEHPDEGDCPALEAHPSVDPAGLVLVRRSRAVARWTRAAGMAVVLSGALVIGDSVRDAWRTVAALADCTPTETARPLVRMPSAVAPSTVTEDRSRGADLAAARDLYRAGNYAAALPIFQRAAAARNPEAMGFLGIMYLRGQGTPKKAKEAIELLRDAGGERDVQAMKALAAAYQSGDGVNPSFRWTLYWYKLAAEHGDTEAMREIGNIYRDGRGVARDSGQALEWYRKAVRTGSADAMVDVGRMFEHGAGAPRDAETAHRCYRTAAEAGSARAMFEMGRVYQERQDYEAAGAWYLKGAAAGSAEAMNNLGVLYQNGWGVQQDSAEAMRWFRRAAASGSTVASGNLVRLAR